MSVERNFNFAQQLPFPLQRVFAADQPIPPAEHFGVMFTLNGAGADSDMVVSEATSFKVIVPASKVYLLHSIEIHLIDASVDPDKFGGIAALANGCLIRILDDDGSTVLTNLSAQAIKSNADFGHLGSIQFLGFLGAVNDLVEVSYNIYEAIGHSLYLTAGQAIEILVQDDLTGLVHFEASAHGRVLDDS